MPHPRRIRGGGPKASAERCEDCESMKKSGSTSKVSQGTLQSDAASKGNLETELSDDRRVLLAITVEIEDGCVEHIQLKEGDSAEAVATKFCQEHALPNQFVAPLTEHIVGNILSISKEDSDIVFHSQEEPTTSFEDQTSPLRGGSPVIFQESQVVDSAPKPPPMREFTGGAPPAVEAETVNRDVDHKTPCRPCNLCQKPCARKRRKRGKKVSERLLAPTITSLAKTGAFEYKEKHKSTSLRPLSEPAKAVCMRLYTEYIRHERRSRDEVKRSKASYQQNVVRKKMGLSKTSWKLSRMRGKIAKQYRNYGELLYAEGLTMKQNHLEAIAEKKKEDEAKELAEVKATPKISKRAKNMRRGGDKVWMRLNDFNSRPEQLQGLRQMVWESKLMECTFRPRINHNWKFEAGDEIDYSSCFEHLFLDAESRRRRRAEYMEWFPEGVTFMPCINRGFPNWVEEQDNQCEEVEGCVFRRLLENASRVVEKKQMQERLAHRPLDPRTGRELFIPHTGRKPTNNRNPAQIPIGEYLYRMKFSFDRKIRSLNAEDWKMKKELAERFHIGPNSQRLLERLRQRGLRQIFEAMDDDKDGYVDLTTANFDRINYDVVNKLMDTQGTKCFGKEKKVNFRQFVDLMLHAEKKDTSGQSLHLGLKHKTHASESSWTFQSEMDRRSRNLATKRRKFSTHDQWFNIIINELAKRQKKVEEWRKERQKQEMAACTFKPERISSYKAKKTPEPSEKPSEPVDPTMSESIKDIIQKLQQEVHGFYFQDERGGPELVGMPAPLSPVTSCPTAVVTRGTSVTPPSDRRPKHCSTSPSQARQDAISELDDLPKANTPLAKSRMFFGLMGA